MTAAELSGWFPSPGSIDAIHPKTPPRRWVVVVWPDRASILGRLGRTFGQSSWVEVVVDRRRAERRQRSRSPALERRLADRRGSVAKGGIPGFRLAYRGDGFDVYEATSFLSTHCGECGVTVIFEMPRFGEPPARLELEVIHEQTEAQHAPGRARHLVEIQSFGATGRPLLAARQLARTRYPWTEPSA